MGNMDVCAQQYLCATALFILSCLLHSSNVIIDCVISDIFHGKNVVYGTNTADKRFLIDMMNKTQFNRVQEENNRIASHYSTPDVSVSLEKEYYRILSDV